MIQGQEFVRVAVVLRPHGRGGEVTVELLGGDRGRLRPGLEVRSELGPFRIEEVRGGQQRLICRLSGVEDPLAAARLRGRYLEVPVADARVLPEGEFFHFQLLGLEVRDRSGRPRGEVVDVEVYPANDVYLVRSGDRELRVPATREAVLGVDLERQVMTVADPFLEEWVDAL